MFASGLKVDDARYLELVGDQATDQEPQDWLEKLLSNLNWDSEDGGDEEDDARYHGLVTEDGGNTRGNDDSCYHLQHLEDEGREGYLEDSEVDILHDGLATHELQEQQDSLKGRGDPGKATAVQVDRKKTSSKAKAELEVICQVGGGLYPAHNFVRASGFESLPKELKESNNLKRFGETINAIHDAVE